MGLEVATDIDGLVTTNPPSSDDKRQGDDHLRLIKTVLKNNFKNTSGRSLYFPTASSKSASFVVASTDKNVLFLCDTTAGTITATLPALALGDAGWTCSFMKTNTGVSPILIAATGLMDGTLDYVRRTMERKITEVLWTGSSWIASRPAGLLVGQVVEYYGATLPNGFLWCDGSAFSAVDYLELSVALGGTTLPDCRGRVSAARDNMGSGDAGRLGSVIVGDALMTGGGSETSTLAIGNLPPHAHAVTGSTALDSPGHNHSYETPNSGIVVQAYSAGVGATVWDATRGVAATGNPNQSHQHSVNIASDNGSGASTAFSNMPPTIICNKIMCAE